jgi:hypothetical protein
MEMNEDSANLSKEKIWQIFIVLFGPKKISGLWLHMCTEKTHLESCGVQFLVTFCPAVLSSI